MRSRKLTSGVSFCLELLLLAMSLVLASSLPTLSSPPVVEAESAVEPESMPVVEPGPESRDLLLIPILESRDITEGVNFELIDQHALDAPEWAEESVESLAAYLIEPAQNDLEKVRAIFRWITHNIAYDREGLRAGIRGDQSAEGALASRKVVCEGYSRLFKALGHLAGLEVAYITGWVREERAAAFLEGTTPLEDPNYHAWNAVRIGGDWYLLDTTWADDNAIVEEFFFLTPPDQLIYTHFPRNPIWQLLEIPITREEFTELLLVRPSFFRYNLEPISQLRPTIETRHSITITISAPEDIQLSARLEQEDQRLPRTLTFVQREGEHYIIEAVFPDSGDYCLIIFAGKREAEKFKGAIQYRVKVSEGLPGPIGFLIVGPASLEKWEFVNHLVGLLSEKVIMNMNGLDIGIIVVLGILALLGMKRGLIKSVVPLVGVILGMVLAGRLYHPLAEILGFIKGESLAEIIAVVLIFTIVYVIVSILGSMLYTIPHMVSLGWVDRLGGAVFGFAMGWIICSVFVVLLLLAQYMALPAEIPEMLVTELGGRLEDWRGLEMSGLEPIRLLEAIRLSETIRLSAIIAISESKLATVKIDSFPIIFSLLPEKFAVVRDFFGK